MKLLTEAADGPKTLAAGNAGFGLYARALAYCGKHETDGQVPLAWVDQATARKEDQALAKHLMDVGLWQANEKGFYITDFTEVNRSKEEMKALRESRSLAGKKGGSSKRQAKGKAKGKQNNSSSSSTSSSLSSSVSVLSAVLSSEFTDWLQHYHRVTGRADVRGSTEAKELFKARRKDWSVDELKQATVGCHSDDWRVEKAHDVPVTILRGKNVEGYIAAASNPKKTSTSSQDRLLEMQRRLEKEGR